jgi:hypothetical protein
MSVTELQERGLMRAWRFNVLQSTLSAAPASILAFILGRFDDLSERVMVRQVTDRLWVKASILVDSLPGVPSPAHPPFEPFAIAAKGYLAPVLFPLSLGLMSLAAARALVLSCDPEARRVVRLEFLYQDGAFGLWSQMIIAAAAPLPILLVCMFSATRSFFGWSWLQDWDEVMAFAMVGVAALRQVWLTSVTFPRRLVALSAGPRWRQWTRYFLFVVGAMGVVLVTLEMMLDVFALIAGRVLTPLVQLWLPWAGRHRGW